MHRLLLAAAMLFLNSSPSYSQFSAPNFHDDFEDGSAVDGDPVMWVFDSVDPDKDDPRLFVSGGRYILAPDETSLLATRISNYPLSDFSIKAQFRFVAPGGRSFAGVFGRSIGTGVDNYWAGVGTDGQIYSGIQLAQNVETLRSEPHSFDLFGKDVVLEMDFVGRRIRTKFWQAGSEEIIQLLEFENEQLPEGNVLGLWINPLDDTMPAAFEFVEVAPIIDRFDFDTSGELNVSDINEVAVKIVSEFDSIFDLDYDGAVDSKDAGIWLRDAAIVNGFAEAYFAGDTNLDGTTDAADLNALALDWLQSEAAWSGGDFDFSGVTDVADLNALALNWQKTLPIADTMTAMLVPEPSPLLLGFTLVTVILFLPGRMRRIQFD